ncbi:DNA-methyltransferase [Ponticoccus alexandrii]|uniref:Methyltransferase n=1 Tax=Ponticoccus alexandrii TaxID=1943633 RepID=A0ABX7F7C0_9RHOB|nr:site-specific DNA-methyltransferase [Ponticoccus alexandrii]QRF66364.1 hypothetical protein GQA70_08610 [Ponticoccus alexandrii]
MPSPFPSVEIGDCLLINGDMREVLPVLTSRAKLCLSDPPYPLTAGGNSTGEMVGCFAHGVYDNSGALFDLVEWSAMAPLIFDALAPDADAVIMTSDREEGRARAAFEQSGFAFHRLLIWDKVTATPNRWYMPNCELALYLYKGRARRITDCASKALIRCPQRDVSHLYLPRDLAPEERRPHATEKPVALMRYWLENSTDAGDLVLDPFMGAGSTVIAAAQAGRPAIGIEKDPKWFRVACARVAEAVDGVAQAELAL